MRVHEPTATCTGEATFGPNPYLVELYGDETPVWMCECDRDSAAADV